MEQHTEQQHKTWHQKHTEDLSLGDKVADIVAKEMGSWRFIIIQTIIVLLWMALNVVAFCAHWDVYPFILLNLVFSTQAAYAAPIIMMAQNRQNERDRAQAHADFHTNVKAKKEIDFIQEKLCRLEEEKIDKILKLLEDMDAKNKSGAGSEK
ncbi:MAG: DUF1003 domain-containing protein [Chitinophagia bacterium]|nr:DUF1003 domain-containing protein [Chitinophagia bacterium]